LIEQFREKVEKRHDLAREWKAKTGEKVAAYFYSLVPKEIIHAAGMLPVQLMEAKDGGQLEQESQLQTFVCGLARNVSGQVYRKVYDYADLCVVSVVCDTNRRVFDIWDYRKLFPKMILVGMLQTRNEGSLQYLTEEFDRFRGKIGEFVGKEITDDMIRESIEAYNENRALFRELYKVRAQNSEAISGSDVLDVVRASLVMPVEEHSAMLKQLLDSLPATPASDGKLRLMLCAYNFNIASEVSRIAERMGAAVIADDLTYSIRYNINEIDTGKDVMEALADGYLLEIPAPGLYSFDRKMDFLQKQMDEAKAAGLIYVVQSMCDAYAFEYAIMKDKFEEKNIPYLHMEVEDTPSSAEHMNTRIQSFVESLS